MEIYLIRHTTPAVPKDMIYGRTDVALAATFDAEKEIVLSKLPPDLNAVYTSPSARCTQLAACLLKQFSPDERLYEFNFGCWEGKTWATVDPQESAPWMQDFVNVCTPEGESMLQMQERVMSFWIELNQQPYQKVAVVTHGGVIRLILATIRNVPLASSFDMHVNFGEVILVHMHQCNETAGEADII